MTPHLHLQWRSARETVDGLDIQPDAQWGLLHEPGHDKFAVYRHCHKGNGEKVWVPLIGRFQTKAEALTAIDTHGAERAAGDVPQ